MLFKKVKEIEEAYEMGEPISQEDLSGEYYVVVPWFPWLSLELLKHRKSVGEDGNGANVIAGGLRFGDFELVEEDDALLIDYDQPGNGFAMRGVVDRLRKLDDGRIIGKLSYKVLGKEVFLMYFRMVPKDEYEK